MSWRHIYINLSLLGEYLDGSFPIRLTRLLPGAPDDKVHIELVETTLYSADGGDGNTSYEALSYAWGPGDALAEIFVHKAGSATSDLAAATPVLIRRNLHSALVHLRYAAHPRLLWIDALCINQEDSQEKSLQVSRMVEIYRKTQIILIWLGPGADNSGLALKTLEALEGERENQVKLDVEAFEALVALVSRTWFERLWVQQEVSVGSEVIVVCGHHSTSWTEMKKALFYLCSSTIVPSSPGDADQGAYERLNQRLAFRHYNLSTFWRRYEAASSLFHFLDGYRQLNCVDPRDRIYALSAMGSKSPTLQHVVSDYSASVQDVYQQVVLIYLATEVNLRLLEFCEDPLLERLPSWVPDWTSTPYTLTHPRSPSAEFRCEVAFSGDTLRAKGVYCSRVKAVHRVDLSGVLVNNTGRPRDVAKLTQALRALLPDNSALELTEPRIEIMSQALRQTYWREQFIVEATETFIYPSLACTRRDLQRSYGSRDAENEMLKDRSMDDLASLGSSSTEDNFKRVIFLTDDGKLGTGPRSTSEGDEIFAFLGCSAPIILRPAGQSQHQVIGPAIAEGLTTGEALLGPLTAVAGNFVRKYVRLDGAIVLRYLDQDTGEVHSIDPRFYLLSGLSEEEKSQLETPNQWYRKINSDLLNKSGFDIREVQLV